MTEKENLKEINELIYEIRKKDQENPSSEYLAWQECEQALKDEKEAHLNTRILLLSLHKWMLEKAPRDYQGCGLYHQIEKEFSIPSNFGKFEADLNQALNEGDGVYRP